MLRIVPAFSYYSYLCKNVCSLFEFFLIKFFFLFTFFLYYAGIEYFQLNCKSIYNICRNPYFSFIERNEIFYRVWEKLFLYDPNCKIAIKMVVTPFSSPSEVPLNFFSFSYFNIFFATKITQVVCFWKFYDHLIAHNLYYFHFISILIQFIDIYLYLPSRYMPQAIIYLIDSLHSRLFRISTL